MCAALSLVMICWVIYLSRGSQSSWKLWDSTETFVSSMYNTREIDCTVRVEAPVNKTLFNRLHIILSGLGDVPWSFVSFYTLRHIQYIC